MSQLSPHFSLSEFTSSETATRQGIDNTPSPQVITNLMALCYNVLEPLHDKLGEAIFILSGYRCPQLNKAIGGAPDSQHQAINEDEAAGDIRIKSLNTEQLFNFILNSGIPFDQLICEFSTSPSGGWVHISWSKNPRRQALRAEKIGGKTIYSPVSLPTV